MAARPLPSEGFHPLFPTVKLHRCPICYFERIPILGDRFDREYFARCPGCGFEGHFPAGSKSASSVRRWTSNELRKMRRAVGPIPDPHPKLTAAELAAEEGDPNEEG
jgi:hypothetical protein